jgi:hypothetical protein
MQMPPTLFSHVTRCLYATEFARAVSEHPNKKPPRGLSAYDHFLALCFGQLTGRESLRDVVTCLNSRPDKLYHMGFRGRITRTNLAYGNQHRDWRVFQSVAQVLMRRAASLYPSASSDPELPSMVFALDSTIISLSLALFPWGYYARSRRAAVKLHMLLSLQGNLPAWAVVTQPHLGDLRMLEEIPLHSGAHYVMDRGYMDFGRLVRLQRQGVYFVVRCKEPVRFKVLNRRRVNRKFGLRCDQTVGLSSSWSKKSYPDPLRKIRFFDSEHKVMLVLLTNNLEAAPEVITELYRRRWQVELFCKWMKQHLQLRSLYGRSQNAVRCQIWCAICAYLMMAILKKQARIDKSLNDMVRICSVNIFSQEPLAEIFANGKTPETQTQDATAIQNMLPL